MWRCQYIDDVQVWRSGDNSVMAVEIRNHGQMAGIKTTGEGELTESVGKEPRALSGANLNHAWAISAEGLSSVTMTPVCVGAEDLTVNHLVGIDNSSYPLLPPGPPPPLKTRSVLRGDDVLLPCDQPSNLARALWMFNGSVGLRDGQDGYRVGVDGLLVTDTQPEHSGNYSCYAEENSLRTLLALYSLKVRQVTPAPAPQAPAIPGAQLAPDVRLLYVMAIAALGGLCLILASSLLYVACLRGVRGGGRRRKYSLGRAARVGGSAVQLQTISGQCPGEEDDGDDGEGAGVLEGGCLQIIPGEGAPAPPPPPPPPPPTELTNGLVALPSRLRRMNGNSYVLLRQSNNGVPAGPCSFAEELSRILEKRKHTQLVEHLDESSV